MEALKASGVCRRYGKQEVLKDFALTLEAGSFEALMGPSGSGKSTFLHLAAGLLAADAGEIRVGGADIVRMSDAEATRFRRRHVGVVFQAFNLLNEMSVRDNILLPAKLDGATGDLARFDSLVRLLGLSDKLGRKPEDLSGGEQQRVAIARAIVKRPQLLLCDEPTGALDYVTGKLVLEVIARINSELGTTAIVITHNAAIAGMADRVVRLADGAVASIETPPRRLTPAELSW